MAELTIETNCEYDAYVKRWARVRAFNNGEAKLKEFDLKRVGVGTSLTNTDNCQNISFLRLINPTNKSDYNTQRNINMINGAVLFNGVVKTRSGLLGMLYRKPPVKAPLPELIEYIYDNVDGSGLSMTQQSRSVSSDVVSIGRDGLLTDMPRNDEGTQLTQADVSNGFRASIQEYKAESIVDWHESIVNNVKVLDMLILCEMIETFSAGSINTREKQKQYKVYRLTDGGVTVEILKEFEKVLSREGEGVPVLGANNTQLTAIPFVFVGSKNNQPSIDNLPLEPIVNVNTGHYQESANLASSSFQLSACQPWVADDNYAKVAQDKAKNGGSVELGEDSLIVLRAGGTFNFASPPPNPLSKSVQDGYKEQMIELGAQLITSGGMAETAEAARLKHASDVSDLEVISDNISQAYTKSLEYVCLFMGIEYKPEYTFMLNSEFFEMKLSADEALKLVQVWQGGAINKDVLDANLVGGKVIAADVDLELMNQAIDEEQASSVDFEDETVVAE